jgi:hypothetical protein
VSLLPACCLSAVPPSRERFYVLDAKNRPVEVFDREEWSRWMTENELIFRRTLLDESGVTVTTRFRGVSEAKTGEASLFVTRVAGMEARNNKINYRSRRQEYCPHRSLQTCFRPPSCAACPWCAVRVLTLSSRTRR